MIEFGSERSLREAVRRRRSGAAVCERARAHQWSPREAVRHKQAKRGCSPRRGTFESIDQTREKLGNPSDLALL
jgi:hypothetical protein